MYIKKFIFILNILKSTVEYQNKDNIFFLIGLILAILMFMSQLWGLLSQNKKILQGDSQALSLVFFSGQFLYFLGYTYYGICQYNITIFISSLAGLIFLPIVFNLARKKIKQLKIISTEKSKQTRLTEMNGIKADLLFTGLLFLVLLPAYGIKNKNILLVILLIAVIISIIPQVYHIFKYKTLKNISYKYILSLIISSLLYLSYGIMIEIHIGNSWGIIVTAVASLIGMSILYILKIKKFAE